MRNGPTGFIKTLKHSGLVITLRTGRVERKGKFFDWENREFFYNMVGRALFTLMQFSEVGKLWDVICTVGSCQCQGIGKRYKCG